MIENAASEITHDVVTEHAARLGRAGHNQVVITLARFSENLIDHDSVADTHFRWYAEFFQILFLAAEIDSKFRTGFEQAVDVLFESGQIGINSRRFGHDMEQSHRRADAGRKFPG